MLWNMLVGLFVYGCSSPPYKTWGVDTSWEGGTRPSPPPPPQEKSSPSRPWSSFFVIAAGFFFFKQMKGERGAGAPALIMSGFPLPRVPFCAKNGQESSFLNMKLRNNKLFQMKNNFLKRRATSFSTYRLSLPRVLLPALNCKIMLFLYIAYSIPQTFYMG